jgi:hypothetical protein
MRSSNAGGAATDGARTVDNRAGIVDKSAEDVDGRIGPPDTGGDGWTAVESNGWTPVVGSDRRSSTPAGDPEASAGTDLERALRALREERDPPMTRWEIARELGRPSR